FARRPGRKAYADRAYHHPSRRHIDLERLHLRALVLDRPGHRDRGSRDDGRRRDLRADRRRVVDGDRGWPKDRVQLAVPDIALPDHGPRFVDAVCDAELAEGPEVP